MRKLLILLVAGLFTLGLAVSASADNPNSWNLYTSGNSGGYHCDMGTPQEEGGTDFVSGPYETKDDCEAHIPVPTPTPSNTPTPPVTVCNPGAVFGPWYGDPRINITLTGPGSFVVRGGIQRFSNTRVVRVTLACGESFRLSRYKVHGGRAVRVYLNGVLFDYRVAPTLH